MRLMQFCKLLFKGENVHFFNSSIDLKIDLQRSYNVMIKQNVFNFNITSKGLKNAKLKILNIFNVVMYSHRFRLHSSLAYCLLTIMTL